MIRKLVLKKFLVHQDLTLDFVSGLTAITGPNASGKSTILMAIRYALFGAPALNGKVEDVKGSEVTLTFRVRGQDYTVIRTTSNARLVGDDDAVLAIGTKPVSAKIGALFGYGLDVFDVAHCANQGEIEALSAMRPADRKRLIDTTVGLGVIEELEKWCAAEVSGFEREIEAIKRALVAVPDEPAAPADPRPLSELVSRERVLSEVQRKRDKLTAEASIEVTSPGPAPTAPFLASVYQEALRQRQDLTALAVEAEALQGEAFKVHRKIESINTRPELMRLGTSDLAGAQELADTNNWLNANPAPEHSLEYLDQQEALHEDLHAWKRWHDLRAKGEHTCPACSHSWPMEAKAMEELGDWEGKACPEPALSLTQIRKARADIRAFEHIRGTYEQSSAAFSSLRLLRPDLPVCKPREVADEVERREQSVRYDTLMIRRADVLARLSEVPDPSPAIFQWESYLKRHKLWEAQKEDYDIRLSRKTKALAELVSIPDPGPELASLVTAIAERRAYDAAMAARAPMLEARAKQDNELACLEARGADHKAARKALGALRTQVKSYLTPSLSKAASALLSRMTAGARNDLMVADDFEVTVDGQPINTLSGSEKAAANLALRIGLGQVLTNKVFSVFMADEPDAAMDANRAAATAEAFDALKPLLGQIVLVSHKRPTADAYVELDSPAMV